MKTLALLATLLVVWSDSAWACLWVSGERTGLSLDGKRAEPSNEVWVASRENLTVPDDSNAWRKREEELRPAMSKVPTVRERADYGGVLAHLHQFNKARVVLEEAEKLEPGDYAVASNLGTVNELLGDNQKARTWIAEGMKRRAGSHGGTEWLHLMILDAKLQIAADPEWLQTHRVLGVDYGLAARPTAPRPHEDGDRERLRALTYQLRERLKFVKAPEPIVGELLFALGDELCLHGAVETGVPIYELAATYQPVQIDLLQRRTEYAREVVRKAGAQPASAAAPAPAARPKPAPTATLTAKRKR